MRGTRSESPFREPCGNPQVLSPRWFFGNVRTHQEPQPREPLKRDETQTPMVQQPDLSPQTEIILNSIADGVFTVDQEWRITSFNRAASIKTAR